MISTRRVNAFFAAVYIITDEKVRGKYTANTMLKKGHFNIDTINIRMTLFQLCIPVGIPTTTLLTSLEERTLMLLVTNL